MNYEAFDTETLYERMVFIRAFERRLLHLFAKGRISGTTHTCMGQEAIAVAVGANLRAADVVFSSHRCHGHFIASGGDPKGLLAELMGKETGVCRGRGGSQHLHSGNFFSSGVQGGIVGNAVGAALAKRHLGLEDIVVVFLGDGTLGEGLVYESLNFAALHSAPVLFVLEDNGYAQTTPRELGVSGSMTGRATAFGIAADETSSNDVVELAALFRDRIGRVRDSGAPFFQVVHTYRLGPHSKGDDHRDPAEIAAARAAGPLALARKHLGDVDVERLMAKAEAALSQMVAEVETGRDAGHAFEITAGNSPVFENPPASAAGTFVKALNNGLARILEADARAVVIGEDLLDPYGGAFGVMRGLSTRFPKQVIPAPISEAGIVAWSIGAALQGLRPIAEIMFGDFLALAADQLLNHAVKYGWVSDGRATVPVVVRTPMGGGRGYGPTHSQSIEKLFLGIPGLNVVAPSHLMDPGILLERAVALEKPTLFIEHKLLYPRALAAVINGKVGDFFVRATRSRFPTFHLSLSNFERPNACIVAYGEMAFLAMAAAESLLIDDELLVDVVAPTLLSPMPRSEIAEYVADASHIVTVEEGQKECGWGAEIAAMFAETGGPARRVIRVAATASPVPAARTLELRALPSVEDVIRAIRRSLS